LDLCNSLRPNSISTGIPDEVRNVSYSDMFNCEATDSASAFPKFIRWLTVNCITSYYLVSKPQQLVSIV
jgi:hypothetical protein